VLGAVSFLTDLSSEMIYPFIPLFLVAALGASKEVVGLIEGVAESTASVLKAFSGWVSDRMRARKPLVTVGYGISAVSKPLLALAHVWPTVLVLRFSERLGKGIRTAPRDALLAETTPPAIRGRAFGFHRMLDTLGAVAGPLLAYVLLRLAPENYRLLFLLSGIPAILAVILILGWVREPRRVAAPSAPRPLLCLSDFSPAFRRYLFVSVLFAVGNSSDVFIILRASDLGFTALQIPLLYLVFNVSYAALAMPAGILSDRIGRRALIIPGYIFFAAVYLGFALVHHHWAVWGLFALYGVYHALTDGTGRALAADLTSREWCATGLGAYHALVGIALLPASVIAGVLWHTIGPAAPFAYGAVTAVLAAILLPVLVRPIPAAC
jgi:MFS family permease